MARASRALAGCVALLAASVSGLDAQASAFQRVVARREAGSLAAALPLRKQRVAVVGAGGGGGALCFGLLQRAAQTATSGLAQPKALVGTPKGSKALNKVLGSKFVLAYAGEDAVKLTDFDDGEAVSRQLENCDAAVLPYRLSREGGDWAFETDLEGEKDSFARILAAAKDLRHVVVLASFADAVAARTALSDLRPRGGFSLVLAPPLACAKKGEWTFHDGPRGDLQIRKDGTPDDGGVVYAEDVAEVVRLVVVLLDASKQRTIRLGAANGPASIDGWATQLLAKS
ncbi:hypothetical protein M885DRAFT_506721 [Pelagophyceae sp. CCMP2097]|nr:hypothetical protein M885DRAFT_506721 [Pelagophyceae sp. CCMP2097]